MLLPRFLVLSLTTVGIRRRFSRLRWKTLIRRRMGLISTSDQFDVGLALFRTIYDCSRDNVPDSFSDAGLECVWRFHCERRRVGGFHWHWYTVELYDQCGG